MAYPKLAPVLDAILETVPARKILLSRSRARGEVRLEKGHDLLVAVPSEPKTMRVWKDLDLPFSKAQKGLNLDLVLAKGDLPEATVEDWREALPSGGHG